MTGTRNGPRVKGIRVVAGVSGTFCQRNVWDNWDGVLGGKRPTAKDHLRRRKTKKIKKIHED